MTPFQLASITLLAFLFARELWGIRSLSLAQAGRWIRALVWAAAAFAIAQPGWVQAVAETVGINRGADLVFYLFVLAFVGAAFYFYSRLIQTRRQITQLVRHLSIQEAQRGAILQEIKDGTQVTSDTPQVHHN